MVPFGSNNLGWQNNLDFAGLTFGLNISNIVAKVPPDGPEEFISTKSLASLIVSPY